MTNNERPSALDEWLRRARRDYLSGRAAGRSRRAPIVLAAKRLAAAVWHGAARALRAARGA